MSRPLFVGPVVGSGPNKKEEKKESSDNDYYLSFMVGDHPGKLGSMGRDII